MSDNVFYVDLGSSPPKKRGSKKSEYANEDDQNVVVFKEPSVGIGRQELSDKKDKKKKKKKMKEEQKPNPAQIDFEPIPIDESLEGWQQFFDSLDHYTRFMIQYNSWMKEWRESKL